MKTNKSLFDTATDSLKHELNSISSPDFSEIILAKSLRSNPKPHSYWLAAAILVIALNSTALWVSWNYNQTNDQQTDLVENLYNENSTWDTFLTFTE